MELDEVKLQEKEETQEPKLKEVKKNVVPKAKASKKIAKAPKSKEDTKLLTKTKEAKPIEVKTVEKTSPIKEFAVIAVPEVKAPVIKPITFLDKFINKEKTEVKL